MTIELYTGTPGSGKSLHMAEDIFRFSSQGRPVAANFPIKRNCFMGGPIFELNENLDPRYFVWLSNYWFKEKGKRFHEDEILVCLDEAQLIFNSRTWNEANRKDWIRLFTQHRKYGLKFVLATQFEPMLDKQIRSLCEHEVIHRKVANMGFIGRVMSAFTANRLFVAVTTYHGMNLKIKSEFFLRSPLNDRLYDSHIKWEPEDWGAYIPPEYENYYKQLAEQSAKDGSDCSETSLAEVSANSPLDKL